MGDDFILVKMVLFRCISIKVVKGLHIKKKKNHVIQIAVYHVQLFRISIQLKTKTKKQKTKTTLQNFQ